MTIKKYLKMRLRKKKGNKKNKQGNGKKIRAWIKEKKEKGELHFSYEKWTFIMISKSFSIEVLWINFLQA